MSDDNDNEKDAALKEVLGYIKQFDVDMEKSITHWFNSMSVSFELRKDALEYYKETMLDDLRHILHSHLACDVAGLSDNDISTDEISKIKTP